MIILTETDQKLSLSPDTAADLHVSVSFVDLETGGSFTPSSQEEFLAAASPADILDEPASGVKRQVKALSVVNAHPKLWNRVRVRKHFGADVRQLSPTFFLRPRSSAQFADRLGWKLLTDQHPGCSHSSTRAQSGYNDTANSHTPTQQEFRAVCLGFAPSAVTHVRVQPRVNTAPTSVVWAEAFLLAGVYRASDAESFARVIGYLDISSLITAVGGQNYVIPAMIPIKPGARIWAGVVNFSTGNNVSWRASGFLPQEDPGATEFTLGRIGRPSLSLGRVVSMQLWGTGMISMPRTWIR